MDFTLDFLVAATSSTEGYFETVVLKSNGTVT